MDTIGKRIVYARAARGWNAKQLAARLGISAKQVSAWETDQVIPRPASVHTLCFALNVSLEWLKKGEGRPPHPDDVVETAVGGFEGEAPPLSIPAIIRFSCPHCGRLVRVRVDRNIDECRDAPRSLPALSFAFVDAGGG